MNPIIEAVLKLPYKEKVEILYALRIDLGWDDEILEEDDLTPEKWAEIRKREKMLESGEAGVMTLEEFKKRLNSL